MAKKIVNGGNAAAYVAYAMSEMATVYPITPIAEMGETCQKWASAGITNFEGMPMEVKEMESELGAAGATHGALSAGTLATTFTSSQGLMLMLPNMFKIAGELLPGVFHIGCRSVASHALSIYGDHSDIMAARTTGFAMLMSDSVQQVHDLAIVAHLSAIDGSIPVLHCFDGFRTSNEMSTIDMLSYEDIFKLIDREKVSEFRRRGMNPEHPDLRGTAQNPDVFFQNREACNKYYDAFPAIVQRNMDKVAAATGRQYHLFDYVGNPEAENIIIAMGSSNEVIEETVNYLNAQGEKVGAVAVHLFRPFVPEKLMEAIPASVKRIAVLDRTKEPGSNGEPLLLDVSTAVQESGRAIKIIGGRYGLSGKDFDPTMAKAVFDELAKENPKRRFTVGINDDVTNLSLDMSNPLKLTADATIQAEFYGIGADGTVGAAKQIATNLGSSDGYYAQAYFSYSAKKSGGYTVSEVRVAKAPIKSEYSIETSDYVACNKDTYVNRFHLTETLREGGTFVLASHWSLADMEKIFPASLKREIANKHLKFYNVDATAIAARHGLGPRVGTIMETVFYHLMPIIPFDQAFAMQKERIAADYSRQGENIVEANYAAIAEAVAAIQQIDYPASWATATDSTASDFDLTAGTDSIRPYGINATDLAASEAQAKADDKQSAQLLDFIKEVHIPCMQRHGDEIPVSKLSADGRIPMGTTAFEKRRIATQIPQWDVNKCVECTECSFVCPHASIRPYLLDEKEKAGAPETLVTKSGHGPLADYQFRIQVYPEDCTGCSSCAQVCPGHALTMVPIDSIVEEQVEMLSYVEKNVTWKSGIVPRATVNGSQFYKPLLEFSGACAGCGETPYVKLVTQLFGERMLIANATGCSSIWGADFPSNSYTVNPEGKGPAWANSLFEDNAEYGYGMAVAVDYLRKKLAGKATTLANGNDTPDEIKGAAQKWLASKDSATESYTTGASLTSAIEEALKTNPGSATLQALYREILAGSDMLGKKSIWAIGGDGWAYDIGFAGLDHVLAQNVNINILVLDTECYSNTGGQASKATPLGASAKYAYDGKRTVKKDLGRMMMTYGHVYVASVAIGYNFMQTVKALSEAEAYDGPSIVIAYCPCIEHGIKMGLGHSIIEEKEAVECGYWPLYRYNPMLAKEGKNPLTIDYQKPDDQLVSFVNGEDRYADLTQRMPEVAHTLQEELEQNCDNLYELMTAQSLRNPSAESGASEKAAAQ